jgi:hypothetical protein
MSDLEIIVNTCYGGFSLSEEAKRQYTDKTKSDRDSWYDVPRDDPDLVSIVKALGASANGEHSLLGITRIPGQYARFYSIGEYDGQEWVKVHYNQYKVQKARAILLNRSLTQTERISRAAAVLGADLEERWYGHVTYI